MTSSDYLVCPAVDADCPPAHGGCRCMCHRVRGVVHCIPCCHPSTLEKDLREDWAVINTLLDTENKNDKEDQGIPDRDAEKDSDT
jgi:hypothetical protein